MIEQLTNLLANVKPGEIVELENNYSNPTTFAEYLISKPKEITKKDSSEDTTQDNAEIPTEEL
jgi:hypothetical protein